MRSQEHQQRNSFMCHFNQKKVKMNFYKKVLNFLLIVTKNYVHISAQSDVTTFTILIEPMKNLVLALGI